MANLTAREGYVDGVRRGDCPNGDRTAVPGGEPAGLDSDILHNARVWA